MSTLLLLVSMTATAAWNDVKDDIVLVGEITELTPGQLASVVYVESSFRSSVSSKTSSAKGLLQITKATGDYLIERYGPDYAIYKGADLHDTRINLILGSKYLEESKIILESKMNRKVTLTEIYLGHKFSPWKAARILKSDKDTTLLELLPYAAKANRAVYYDVNGEPRTIGEVIGIFNRRIDYAYKHYGMEADMLHAKYKAELFKSYVTAEYGDCTYDTTVEIVKLLKEDLAIPLIPIYGDIYESCIDSNDTVSPSGKKYNWLFV